MILILRYQEKHCDDISEIMYPVLHALNINFFSHVRAFHDGTFASLMTETKLSNFYIQQKMPIRYSYGKGVCLERGCYILSHMADLDTQQDLQLIRNEFNLDHFIYLVDKRHGFDDLFIFAAKPDNPYYINIVINNMDFMKKSIHHYKYNARKLLIKSPRLSYPANTFVDNYATYTSPRLRADNLHFKKIYFSLGNSEINLSAQEYTCLHLFIQNYTIKEIAQFLKLSPRTIETYIDNLKHKLHCNKNSQLIDFCKECYLF